MSTVGQGESVETEVPEEPLSRSEDLHGEDDSTLLLQELEQEERRESRRNAELQVRLALYFSRNPPLEEDPESDMREYEDCLEHLVELKKCVASELEQAKQEEQELRLHHQEELKQVEEEWRSLLSVKRKAFSLLSSHLPPEAARAKVDAALASEQLRRQELRKLRLKHARMESRVARLEAELGEVEKAPECLVQLLAQRIHDRKIQQQRNQEASKLQKSMKRTLELLSNIKEKLHWSHAEVKTKQEHLAQLQLAMSSRREMLTQKQRACVALREDNKELKRSRGLLGNSRLLWDFGATVGASQQLHHQLEKLKCRREEIVDGLSPHKSDTSS
ncbi:coiled-coil domain-containing protein 96 [Corythoichthys intestinalis]|uniref:coiled-coil domain-containing protein 96 n=1 Tax=Corythoichthys intestinalis TaxID=161448 RepID=UPI0025A51C45|nr:coiled-coil domain-containing protein 96 [Corythoichthys intestinalis]